MIKLYKSQRFDNSYHVHEHYTALFPEPSYAQIGEIWKADGWWHVFFTWDKKGFKRRDFDVLIKAIEDYKKDDVELY